MQLGEYRVDSASVIEPAEYANEPGLAQLTPSNAYPWLLKLQLSSRVDLQRRLRDEGGAVYLLFSKCPLTDTDKAEQALDFREIAPPSSGPPQRFEYEAILIPAYPMRGVRYGITNMPQTPYDLAQGKGDVCLRLDHPDMQLTRSRSKAFTLRRAVVEKALSHSLVATPQ